MNVKSTDKRCPQNIRWKMGSTNRCLIRLQMSLLFVHLLMINHFDIAKYWTMPSHLHLWHLLIICFSDTINCLSMEKSFCESRMKIWMFFEDFIDRNINKIRIKMNFSKKERNNKFSMII